jgi:hypothetical protein
VVPNGTFWFTDYEGLREQFGQTTISATLSASAREGRLAAGTVRVDPQIARASRCATSSRAPTRCA